MNALSDNAIEILRENDRGTYTVPTKGLYPFQWNWDSCLTALGQRHFDEARAWTEIETLMAHQWPDGMVPHIVFHEPNEGYFPGPEVWGTGRPVPTSGITQPPVFASALRFGADGAPEHAELPPAAPLSNTLWQMERRTRADLGLAHVVKTWEDAPFYARSTAASRLYGERVTVVQESLDLDRFASPIVQFMLPYRMPRRL